MTIYVYNIFCTHVHAYIIIIWSKFVYIFILHYASVVPYRGRGNISQIHSVSQREIYIYPPHIHFIFVLCGIRMFACFMHMVS